MPPISLPAFLPQRRALKRSNDERISETNKLKNEIDKLTAALHLEKIAQGRGSGQIQQPAERAPRGPDAAQGNDRSPLAASLVREGLAASTPTKSASHVVAQRDSDAESQVNADTALSESEKISSPPAAEPSQTMPASRPSTALRRPGSAASGSPSHNQPALSMAMSTLETLAEAKEAAAHHGDVASGDGDLAQQGDVVDAFTNIPLRPKSNSDSPLLDALSNSLRRAVVTEAVKKYASVNSRPSSAAAMQKSEKAEDRASHAASLARPPQSAAALTTLSPSSPIISPASPPVAAPPRVFVPGYIPKGVLHATSLSKSPKASPIVTLATSKAADGKLSVQTLSFT